MADANTNATELHMLTTVDNPYNPYTQFDDWYTFDIEHGYYTSAYLARIVKSSTGFSQADNDTALEEAIDEIVRFNLSGMHIKVTKEEIEQRLNKSR